MNTSPPVNAAAPTSMTAATMMPAAQLAPSANPFQLEFSQQQTTQQQSPGQGTAYNYFLPGFQIK